MTVALLLLPVRSDDSCSHTLSAVKTGRKQDLSWAYPDLVSFHSENPKEDSLPSLSSFIRPLSLALSCKLSEDSILSSAERDKKGLIPYPNESYWQHAHPGLWTCSNGRHLASENASLVKCKGYMNHNFVALL